MAVIRPVDRLVAGYNLLQAVVWSVLLPRAPYAIWILAAHCACLALPWLLRRGEGTGLSRAGRALRECYPLLFIGAFWSELGLVRDLLHPQAFDASIAALDLRLFGVHLHGWWMPRMPEVWFSEIMHLSYFVYYPLIFVPPLVMGLRGRPAAFRDMTYRLLVTYIACYAVYIAFPVDGPSHTMARYAGALTDGVIYRIVHAAVAAGDSMGTAFPSSHVAGAVTIALLGFRWLPRPIAVLMAIEAAGVVAATVYTQQHFAIDSLAGVVWALGLQLLVVPALDRARQHSGETRPVPILPTFDPALGRATTGGAT